jgi:transposase
VVPDNLKSGVTKPCYFSPQINPSYLELARHYDVAILPARVAKPRDKAKVESAVLVASRWIIAALRNHRIFSLAELNGRIAQLLTRLNERPFKKLPGCRKSTFIAIEQAALAPLPATRYTFADWMARRAGIDYHVEIFGHYYSVPHTLAKQQLDARVAAHTVEIFHRGKRVASHVRSRIKGAHTTQDAHMPAAHLRFKNYTPERFVNDAQRIGPHTVAVIKHLLSKRKHPEQGFRACLGVLRLARQHSNAKLEAACQYAVQINAPNFRSIASILKNGLASNPAQTSLLPAHDNVRGATYYH